MLRTARLLSILLLASAGCDKKEAPRVVVDAPAPTSRKAEPAPKEEPKKEPPKKEVKDGPRVPLAPFDLRAYGLYAEIDAPAGTAVIQSPAGDIGLAGVDGYTLSIRPGTAEIARLKKDLALETNLRILIDEPDALLAGWVDEEEPRYLIAANVTVADQPYQIVRKVGSNQVTITDGQARRNLQAARSLRQTPPLAKAQAEHDAAEAALTKLGLTFESYPDGSRQVIGVGTLTLRDADLGLLRRIPELSRVDLQVDAPLTAAALSHLEGLPRLAHLALGGAWVDRTVVRAAAAFGNLRSLRIANTPLTDADLAPLAVLTGLERLDLANVRLSDAGMKAFQECRRLRYLLLNATDVGDGAVAVANGFGDLRELSVSDTAVTDAGIAELAIPGLRRLDLSETVVTDGCVDSIAKMAQLAELNFYGTATTAEAAARLRKALPMLRYETPWPEAEEEPEVVRPPVAIADLPPADPAPLIKKTDAKVTRDEEVLGKPIVALDFRGAQVTDRDLAELRDLTQLRKLDLEDSVGVTQAGLPYLAKLTALEELNLRGTRVFGDGLAHLKDLKNLTRLGLPAGLRLTSRQLEPLAGLPKLETVTFQFPPNDHPVLAVLGRMTALKEVSLETMTTTNRKLRYVAGLKNLESLAIGPLGVWSDRGLAVAKGMPEIKALAARNYQGANAGLAVLKTLGKLEGLELNGPFVSDLGLEAIGGLTELKTLKLSGSRVGDRSVNRLRPLEKLIELHLRSTEVGDKGLEAIGTLKSLEVLDLAFTQVTDEGLARLKEMEELRTLRLDGTAVTGQGLKALDHLPRLFRVYLSKSKASDAGLAALAGLRPLLTLDLGATDVSAAGIMAIKSLPNLRDLFLDNCPKIRDDALPLLLSFRALRQVTVAGTKMSIAAQQDLRQQGITVDGRGP